MPSLSDVWACRGGWMYVGCDLSVLMWCACVLCGVIVIEYDE